VSGRRRKEEPALVFDVLVYLFENYYQNDASLDHDALARKLTAAGFENEDITDALDWLRTLSGAETRDFPEHFDDSLSFRGYSAEETAKITPDGLGFVAFLESARVLTPSLREVILERAMAVEADVVPLDKLKVIVLMVLWARRGDVDTLVLEELLPEGEPRAIH
jgi:Smg protein